MKASHGFTLVELVAVIVIAGILLAVAGPRFFRADDFTARGYQDAAAAFLRHAQKLAVARHATLTVLADAGGLTLCASATTPCPAADQIPGPDGATPYQLETPSGITLTASAASFSFDAQGRPSGGVTLTLTGGGTRTLQVEAETGYVH